MSPSLFLCVWFGFSFISFLPLSPIPDVEKCPGSESRCQTGIRRSISFTRLGHICLPHFHLEKCPMSDAQAHVKKMPSNNEGWRKVWKWQALVLELIKTEIRFTCICVQKLVLPIILCFNAAFVDIIREFCLVSCSISRDVPYFGLFFSLYHTGLPFCPVFPYLFRAVLKSNEEQVVLKKFFFNYLNIFPFW